MTILDSKGQIAQGTNEGNTQNMLRHWLSQSSVVNLLGRLKLLPSGDALARLADHKMDPGEAARIFRAIVLNKKARRYIMQIIALKQRKDMREGRAGLEKDLLALADEMKHLSTAAKSGLVIPS